jgi:hypothetical protein
MRIQSASADIKSTEFSFGIRLPNGLALSFPRPMASVSLSEIRCAVVTLCLDIQLPPEARWQRDVLTKAVHDLIKG